MGALYRLGADIGGTFTDLALVAPDGSLCGRVESARVTPDQVRLTVTVDGLGVLPAVADLPGPGRAPVAVGEAVRLVVDLTRTASVGT